MVPKLTGKTSVKICDRCGAENVPAAPECTKCHKDRFAPSWVLAKRPINRQVSVDITKPNPKYGTSEPRVTLSKWWPGGSATYHIPNEDHWKRIQHIVNDDFAPLLKWDISSPATDGQFEELLKAYKDNPKNIMLLLAAIDIVDFAEDDIDRVTELSQELSSSFDSAQAGFEEAFLAVVKKLPEQKQQALLNLNQLLKNWSLQTITNAAQQVRARLETIDL